MLWIKDYYPVSPRPRWGFDLPAGHSTLFARHAIAWGKLPTKVVSVDPKPRAEIDALCDETIRRPLEQVSLDIFDRLDAGDILFFDGTHRVFTNSDTTAFFLGVIPRLRPGILVHIHDIFLPWDYPAEWNNRYYSEQYLLGAMLLCGAPPFKGVLPNFFTCKDEQLAPKIKAIFDAKPDGKIPFAYNNEGRTPPVSFWIETV